jgi:ribose transport system permease protein
VAGFKFFIKRHGDILPIIVILFIMFLITMLLQRNFWKISNFQNLSRQLSPYIFIAIAQAMVLLLGGLDMALGSLVSFSTVIFASTLGKGAADIVIIIAILILCMAMSVFSGMIVYKFKLPAIVVSLAFSFIWSGVALRIMNVPGGHVPEEIVGVLTANISGFFPMPFLLVIITVALWYSAKRSSMGILIYAVGNSREGAFASGLSVFRAYLFCYCFSGFMIGLAGLMLCAITTSGDPTIGAPLTINSVTAAVLGGMTFSGGQGKVIGSVIGGMVVGMLVNVLFYLRIPGHYIYVVEGVILISAVAMNIIRKRRRQA